MRPKFKRARPSSFSRPARNRRGVRQRNSRIRRRLRARSFRHLARSTTVLERTLGAPPVLPRTSTDLVAADGRFAVSVDPGKYDFFVRPEARSRYPWLVLPSVDVPEGGLQLNRRRLSLPFVYRGDVVIDATTTRVPGALIRAYVLRNHGRRLHFGREQIGCRHPSCRGPCRRKRHVRTPDSSKPGRAMKLFRHARYDRAGFQPVCTGTRAKPLAAHAPGA